MDRVALVLTLLLNLSLPIAYADKFDTQTSSSARGFGMGNAVINTERGGYSVFYNPANIAAKDTGTHFEIVNFQMDANEGVLNALNQRKAPAFTSLGNLYPFLKSNPNNYVGGRFSVYPNITFRNFSVGMLYELNQGAELNSQTGGLLIKARNRFAPVAALSYRLFSGILRFGASAQLVSVGDALTVQDAPIPGTLDFQDYIKSGSGLVLTGGMTLTLPFRFLPSFSVVARSIGDTKFKAPPVIAWGKSRDVADQNMMVDFAYSNTIYLAKRFELKTEFDYRDLTNQLEGGRFRHVSLGAEFILYDMLKLRGGLAHGYLSYGLGFVTRKASLEFAAYTDEKEDRLRGNPDHRYVLQYSFSLFK